MLSSNLSRPTPFSYLYAHALHVTACSGCVGSRHDSSDMLPADVVRLPIRYLLPPGRHGCQLCLRATQPLPAATNMATHTPDRLYRSVSVTSCRLRFAAAAARYLAALPTSCSVLLPHEPIVTSSYSRHHPLPSAASVRACCPLASAPHA